MFWNISGLLLSCERMYIRDLRPGGACQVKVIYGAGSTGFDHHGRDKPSGPTPSAGVSWEADLEAEDKGCELVVIRIPTK